MANLRRLMIDLENKHRADIRNWIYITIWTGIISFGLGGVIMMFIES